MAKDKDENEWWQSIFLSAISGTASSQRIARASVEMSPKAVVELALKIADIAIEETEKRGINV